MDQRRFKKMKGATTAAEICGILSAIGLQFLLIAYIYLIKSSIELYFSCMKTDGVMFGLTLILFAPMLMFLSAFTAGIGMGFAQESQMIKQGRDTKKMCKIELIILAVALGVYVIGIVLMCILAAFE